MEIQDGSEGLLAHKNSKEKQLQSLEGNIVERVVGIVGGAGVGHLIGELSVKNNINQSKLARESSNFEQLTKKERALEKISYKSEKIHQYYVNQDKVGELSKQHNIKIRTGSDGTIVLGKGFMEKIPQEIYGNYQDILDLIAMQKGILEEINTLFGWSLEYKEIYEFY